MNELQCFATMDARPAWPSRGSLGCGEDLDGIVFSYLDSNAESDVRELDAYVKAHPEGSAYHLPAWCRAVGSAYGYRSHILVARRAGRLAGMLPLCAVGRPFGPRRWVSLPFCDLGGPLADDAQVAAALAAHAHAELKPRRLAALELRRSDAATETAGLEGRKVRMLLGLPDSEDALMKSFPPKLRSQIRKAEKNGLRHEASRAPEALDAFYDVYARNMRRLGSPPHSRGWFEAVRRHYGDDLFVMLVRFEDQVVGAGLVLTCGDRAVIPWASTLVEFNRLAPNMLLYYAILAKLAQEGCRQFDFGRSTYGEGTYKFKAQWGALPCALDWQEWKADAPQPLDDNGAGRKGGMRELVEQVWQRLPLSVTNYVGPKVRRYITL
jgi:FemAB-related protein (PEP-CTERM system-associated)